MSDVYNLQRFVEAQESVFSRVRMELLAGHKTSHWMWFIFPQMKGLGHSWMAEKFGITSEIEALEYLKHPVLGPRLVDCVEILNRLSDRTAVQIFGHTDAMKLRSSLTLFAYGSDDGSPFELALKRYFNGEPDQMTLDLL